MGGVFYVEYVKDDHICIEECDSFFSALIFARDLLFQLVEVYSLCYTFDNKKYTLLSYLKYPDGKGKGFTFKDWEKLIKTGKIETDKKLIIKRNEIFEVVFKENRMIRFPSINDLFCWISDFSLVYSFHEFNYMLNLSFEKAVYMDENFVEAYSAEDHYFVEDINEKIKNLELFNIHLRSNIDDGLVL